MVFKCLLNENICSESVSKCGMQTVKRAIVLLYVSLLRCSNVSCGGGETQMLRASIYLSECVWKEETRLPFVHLRGIFFLIKTIWNNFYSFVFGCLSRRLCVRHHRFPDKSLMKHRPLYERLPTFLLSLPPPASLYFLSGRHREIDLERPSSWILH